MAEGGVEGRKAGNRAGYPVGFVNGVRTASVVGAEIGYYQGYAIILQQEMKKAENASVKLKKQQFVDKIIQLCEKIDFNPDNDLLWDQLEFLRKLAKQAGIPGLVNKTTEANTKTAINF